jgi:hypothetical protein
MRRTDCRTLVAAVLAALLVSETLAQHISRVTPEAAEPGDLVLLTGTSLGGTTTVRFSAAGGYSVAQVPPVQVTPTSVTAFVPMLVNFAVPPTPIVPMPVSSPLGVVDVGTSSVQFSNSRTFFYMEQTAGLVTTPGLGTTQGALDPIARAVVGFRIVGGTPIPGSPFFTLTLENATPTAFGTLVVGLPAPAVIPYLDGQVGIDVSQPFLVLPTFTVDPAGDVNVFVPMPSPQLNVTVTALWVVADPASTVLGITNGLSVKL